ncbi:MAG: DUF58 domain-containing protein, partial [Anaerolineae bacterium]
ERTFPWKGPIRFEDLESGETVLVSGNNARAMYLEQFQAYQQGLRLALGQLGVSLDTFDIDQPMDEAMYRFMMRRNQRVR